MSIDGLPWGVEGNTAEGLALPLRGVVYALGADVATSAVPTVFLSHAKPPNVPVDDEPETGTHLSAELYQDGVFRGNAGEANSLPVPTITVGRWTEIGPIPTTLIETRNEEGNAQFWSARAVGNRACLAWSDTPSDVDFEAFLIYWDAGLGGTPETLLVSLPGFGPQTYTTGALPAGAYRFAIAYRDVAGNESALGGVLEIDIKPVPAQVAGLDVDYDETTRTAEITFTPPATDVADVRAYLVFDNWVPGAEALGDYPNSETGLERGVIFAAPGDTEQAFTTPELWTGVWRFTVLGMNAEGVLGPGVEQVLHLQLDDGDLVEVLPPPAEPILLDVAPIANGAYRARVRVETEVGLTQLWILEDGVETEQVTLTGAASYTVDGDTRADGTVVVIGVRAKASATVFTDGNEIVFVADAEPPTGDGVLVGEACF